MKIEEILNKNYNFETKYQRERAWNNNKIRNLLIDSVMNDYHIPSIIVANNEVIDGKQRLLTLSDYFNNVFQWEDTKNGEKYFFSKLSLMQRNKFSNGEINVTDLGNISDEKILETFVRINEGSISLNKAEKMFARALPINRNMIREISANKNILLLTDSKKKDTRFSVAILITRSIAIMFMPIGMKGVRTYMSNFLTRKDLDVIDIKNKSNIAIDTMFAILGEFTLPIKSFNTIFEAIFCSFYLKPKSKNSFINAKEKIRKEIVDKIDEIAKNQMGGGIKFDNIDFIIQRRQKIDTILEKYEVDKRRGYSVDEKRKIWNDKEHICEICGKPIKCFADFEMDHVHPYAMGGTTSFDNSRLLCVKCNRQEGVKAREKIKRTSNGFNDTNNKK